MLRIHHLECFDVLEAQFVDSLARLSQHRFGEIDSDDAITGRVVWERDAGPYADFKDPSADLFSCRDCSLAPTIEYGAEDQIVYRSPPIISLRYCDPIEFCLHTYSNWCLPEG